MVSQSVTLIHHLTIMVSSATPVLMEGQVAVVARLSKGYGLDYMWRPTSPVIRPLRGRIA